MSLRRLRLLVVALIATIVSYLYVSLDPKVSTVTSPAVLTLGESMTVDLTRLDPFGVLPRLPNVLLIGDSISLGYTGAVQRLLDQRANVLHSHRGGYENSGSTVKGLRDIDLWLLEAEWHLIYFNWGLHDIGVADPDYRTSVEEYHRNMETLVERMRTSGADLIFATTTPSLKPLKNAQILRYNRAAVKVMQRHGVAVHDLYIEVLPWLEEAQLRDGVHFREETYDRIGALVARVIDRHLDTLESAAPPASR